MSNKTKLFNNTDIAKLAETNRTKVQNVLEGKDIGDPALAKRILDLAHFDDKLKDLFLHPLFWEMCEVAIAKARKTELRKFAVNLQNASSNIRNRLDLEGENEVSQ